MKKSLFAAVGLTVAATTTAGTASAATDPWGGAEQPINSAKTVQIAVDDAFSNGGGWCDKGVPSVAVAVHSLSGTRSIRVIEEGTMTGKTVTVGPEGTVITLPAFQNAGGLTVHAFDEPREGDAGTASNDTDVVVSAKSSCDGLPTSPPSAPADWVVASTGASPSATPSTTPSTGTSADSTAAQTRGTTAPSAPSGAASATAGTAPSTTMPGADTTSKTPSGTTTGGITPAASSSSAGPKIQTDYVPVSHGSGVEEELALGTVFALAAAGGVVALRRR